MEKVRGNDWESLMCLIWSMKIISLKSFWYICHVKNVKIKNFPAKITVWIYERASEFCMFELYKLLLFIEWKYVNKIWASRNDCDEKLSLG